jgi:AraC family transcriptional regulator
MKPEIVSKPAFTVVGIKYRGDNAKGEIPVLWKEEFMPRIGEIRSVTNPDVFYGVTGNYDAATGEFDYLAGLEVSDIDNIPDGMESWSIPEQTYAVFPARLDIIMQIYEQLYSKWLPESGYQMVDCPGFEYYGPDFCDGQKLTIYVPVAI